MIAGSRHNFIRIIFSSIFVTRGVRFHTGDGLGLGDGETELEGDVELLGDDDRDTLGETDGLTEGDIDGLAELEGDIFYFVISWRVDSFQPFEYLGSLNSFGLHLSFVKLAPCRISIFGFLD